MTGGAKIRCCQLSVAVNTRTGRICVTSMHLQTRLLPNGSHSSVRISAEHCSKSGCRQKNAADNQRPKSNNVQTRKSVEGEQKRRNVSETRRNVADKTPKSSAVWTRPPRGNVGETRMSVGSKKLKTSAV